MEPGSGAYLWLQRRRHAGPAAGPYLYPRRQGQRETRARTPAGTRAGPCRRRTLAPAQGRLALLLQRSRVPANGRRTEGLRENRTRSDRQMPGGLSTTVGAGTMEGNERLEGPVHRHHVARATPSLEPYSVEHGVTGPQPRDPDGSQSGGGPRCRTPRGAQSVADY